MRPLTSRGKVMLALVAALVLTLAIGLGFAADFGTASSPAAKQTALAAQKTTAGPVQIKVTPIRLDPTGAVFKVVLDNHEVNLTMNLAQGAALTVGATVWQPASWSGDGPSGHHREGTLSFPAGGSATGQVVLTLAGLPGPVQLQWTLPAGGARP